MLNRHLSFTFSLTLASIGAISPAKADVVDVRNCLEEHARGLIGGEPEVSETVPDAEILMLQIGTPMGLARNVEIIPCDMVQKAESWAVDESGLTQPLKDAGVKPGRYLVYNPTWVREVIGDDRDQAIFLFGHEFGHFLGGHFFEMKNTPSAQKEVEADRFGGCAAGRMGSSWRSVRNLVSRIRPKESDGIYPSAEEALPVVEQGFSECGGQVITLCRKPENGIERWGYTKDIVRKSSPRDGGGTRTGYCAELIHELRVEYPTAQVFEIVGDNEESYSTCEPFVCPKYVYECTVNVKADPVYVEAPCED